jgi:hypothetical protein
MSKEIPTVQIDDGDGGYIVINESDFDKKQHKLYSPKPAAEDKGKKTAKTVKPPDANDEQPGLEDGSD